MSRITRIRSRSQSQAVLLAVAVLVLGIAIAASRSRDLRSQSTAGDSPESCVTRMLAAEKQGDVGSYLSCFDALKRAEMEALWKDRSHPQIADELRESAAGLVGQAVTDVQFLGADRAALLLERIEKDHVDRQRIELARSGGPWEITRLSPSDWQTPAIPYGTPVFAQSRDNAADPAR